MRHFAGERYDLGPWVVMPNHVHVILRSRGHGLASILHSWKSFSEKRINALLGGQGAVWQREFHDRVIPNASGLSAATHYVHQNPVRAGLVKHAEDWEHGSLRQPVAVGLLLGV